MRKFRWSLAIGCLAMATVGAAVGSPSDGPSAPPAAPKREEAPIPIFLNAPADLDAFWKQLARPDFVILDGEQYRRLRQGAETPRVGGEAPAAPIESIEVTGEVSGDWARLSILFKATLGGEGPRWASIRLDGLNLSEVREGPRDLPARVGEGRSWEVELAGRGEHLIVVKLQAPVRSTADGRRVDLPIPPAASTRIALDVPSKVVDASTGLNEPVAVNADEGGQGARLSARMSPRSRIEMTWREKSDPAVKLPVLLSTQGEIAIEVERGAIRTRSSWVVGAIRGSEAQLSIGLEPGEEVLDVEVDRRPAPFETRRRGNRSALIVPLIEPLRPNASRELVINTRRRIASDGPARVTIPGYDFEHARVQTGVLAISRSGPIFLDATPGRGLRRIDPRTELPENLRARPETVLAFEFHDQPFELALGVEPAPPRLLVENRTTITLDPGAARLDTQFLCRPAQGRAFELAVLVPEGLEYEGAGPADVVASAQVVPIHAVEGAVGRPRAGRVLAIDLTSQAREAESFTVHLRGRAALDASRPVAVPLFQPMTDPTTGGQFAVVTDRNVSAEPIVEGEPTSPFRVERDAPPVDWPWPARRPGPELGLLWLRTEAKPSSMPIRLTVRPRSIRHESTIHAILDRKGAEVVDEVSAEVAFGAVNRLDIALPPGLPSRWDVEGVDLAGREPLGQDADGTRRYRLRFARDHAESVRLKIRYRLPYPEPLENGRDVALRLSPIRVLEGTSVGQNVRVSADPGIELTSEAKGWVSSPSADQAPGVDPRPPVRVSLGRSDDRAGPITILARLGPRLALPGLVASRLWIATAQRPEGDLATTASFCVEARDGPMTLGLPPGSRWVRSRIGGREATEGEVEGVAPDTYRIRFPSTISTGPILVAVDYEVPAASASAGWQPPRLLEGGVIQQTAWEVRLIGSRAGVGTPPGWSEENEWYWEGFLWRRRPWKGPAELAQWVVDANFRSPPPAALVEDDPSGRHSYLFSRSGPPTTLRFAVFSRFTLVLLCSGPILLAGLLVLARRPPPRSVGIAGLLIAFGLATFADSSTWIPLAQSAAPGALLWLGALLMHRSLDRRGHDRARPGQASTGNPRASALSIDLSPGVGSDESTAIRVRPAGNSAVSTADHIVLTRPTTRLADDASTTNLRDLR